MTPALPQWIYQITNQDNGETDEFWDFFNTIPAIEQLCRQGHRVGVDRRQAEPEELTQHFGEAL